MSRVALTAEKSVMSASTKLLLSILAGVIAGWLVMLTGHPGLAALVSWDIAAIAYMAATWQLVLGFSPQLVKKYALREDPSRVTSEAILLAASVASLAAVAIVLAAGSQASGSAKIAHTVLAVASVVVSWLIVQTVYTLRYAKLYYQHPSGGVDFADTTEPVYADFAYLAFTLAMTYQVSDTGFKTRQFRTTALAQALLSYGFGTIIIATTINLVAGLGK